MGKAVDLIADTEPLQNWPTAWIDAIAADFFAWKFFALEDQDPQAEFRAKRGARGPGGSAARDDDVEDLVGHRITENALFTLAAPR